MLKQCNIYVICTWAILHGIKCLQNCCCGSIEYADDSYWKCVAVFVKVYIHTHTRNDSETAWVNKSYRTIEHRKSYLYYRIDYGNWSSVDTKHLE